MNRWIWQGGQGSKSLWFSSSKVSGSNSYYQFPSNILYTFFNFPKCSMHGISTDWYIFQVSNYTKELEDMKHMTKQEFIASLRRYINFTLYPIIVVLLFYGIDYSHINFLNIRKSSGFSRGASIYRGVTRFVFIVAIKYCSFVL